MAGVLALRVGGDGAALGPAPPDTPDQGPGVEAGERRDGEPLEGEAERALGAPVADHRGKFLAGETAKRRTRRLPVVAVDPDVADLGVGHDDDLTGVGGIRDHLLVAAHTGVKAHFPGGGAPGAKGPAAEYGAVGQGQRRRAAAAEIRAQGHKMPRSTSYTTRPATRVARTRPQRVRPSHGEFRLFE